MKILAAAILIHTQFEVVAGVIHYLKNKVGVVDFANAQGLVRARGL